MALATTCLLTGCSKPEVINIQEINTIAFVNVDYSNYFSLEYEKDYSQDKDKNSWTKALNRSLSQALSGSLTSKVDFEEDFYTSWIDDIKSIIESYGVEVLTPTQLSGNPAYQELLITLAPDENSAYKSPKGFLTSQYWYKGQTRKKDLTLQNAYHKDKVKEFCEKTNTDAILTMRLYFSNYVTLKDRIYPQLKAYMYLIDKNGEHLYKRSTLRRHSINYFKLNIGSINFYHNSQHKFKDLKKELIENFEKSIYNPQTSEEENNKN